MPRPLCFLLPALAFLLPAAIVSQAPNPTQPPAGQYPVLTLKGQGSQIYRCEQSDKKFQWNFVAPAARLFDASDREVGTHGEGPIWNYQDGSSIRGQVMAKADSPDEASVPWLLLKGVNPQGKGVLSGVEMIRRSDTNGGNAPAAGCDAGHVGELLRVPYTATYTFYSSHPGSN